MMTHDELIKQVLSDPETKAEYDALEDEFKKEKKRLTLSLPNPVSMVDIAVKLNKIPRYTEVKSSKQYQLNLEYNGLRLSIKLKGKSWRKALSTVEDIEANNGQWVMTISGKVGKAGKTVELDGAGVQVFEKKPKPEPQNES